MKIKLLVLFVCLLVLGSCTYITLSEQGKKIQVAKRNGVASCKSIGTTTATVSDTVAGLKRKEHVIKSDLETLARNAAADMGGDTIVPQGKLEGGRRVFNVYKCRGR